MIDHAAEERARRMVDTTGLRAGQVFLDVGGGDGRLCAAIERQSGATGCVLEPEAGDTPGVGHRIAGRAEALPASDGTYDAVVLCHVLHHLDGPDRAINEAIRVLKPEGRVIIITASHEDLLSQPALTAGNPALEHVLSSTPDVAEIEHWIDRAGGDAVSIYPMRTPNDTPYEDWVAGTVLLASIAWAASGQADSDPRPAIEARVRRDHPTVPDTRETLIVARKPCLGAP